MDLKVFKVGVTLLLQHYDKTMPEASLGIWYEFFNHSSITDQQFITAIKQAICTFAFLPTPKQILELVEGDLEAKIALEWGASSKSAIGKTAYDLAIPGSQWDRDRMSLADKEKYRFQFAQIYKDIFSKEQMQAFDSSKLLGGN